MLIRIKHNGYTVRSSAHAIVVIHGVNYAYILLIY
jgi:hypothetical protein